MTFRATLQFSPQFPELPVPQPLSLLGRQPVVTIFAGSGGRSISRRACGSTDSAGGGGAATPHPTYRGERGPCPSRGNRPRFTLGEWLWQGERFPPPSLGLPGSEVGTITPLGLKVILDDCLSRSWWAERRGVGLGVPAGPSFPFPLCLKGVKPEPLLLGRVLGQPRPRSVVRKKGPVRRGPRVTCRAAYGSDTHGPRPSAPLLRTSL